MVEWEDMEARLIRPNLECTNGYIHVIDKVLMKRRDVTLSGAIQEAKANSKCVFLSMILSAGIMKMFQ